MNTERTTESIVETWLVNGFSAEPDTETMLRSVRAGVAATPQRRHHWWPFGRTRRAPVPDSGPAPARGFTMFSAVKFVVASVIVALFSGFVLTGILNTQQAEEVIPAAVTVSPTARSDLDATTQPPTPQPSPTMALLAGMVTEEVEPGVLHVVNDGVRDLTSVDAVDIVAGYDGGIWLLRTDEFLRLGSDGSYAWPGVFLPEGRIFEVAPDGTMWVIPRSDFLLDTRGGPGLRSTDGVEWTVQTCAGQCWGLTVAPDGTVWASWHEEGTGTMAPPRLGHLGPTGWQPLDGPLPLRFGRLFFTDDGDIYGMKYGEDRLFRYEEGGSFFFAPGHRTSWENMIGSPMTLGPDVLGVGRDGTVWVVGLDRLVDGEWERVTSTDHLDIGFGLGLDLQFQVDPEGSLWTSLWQNHATVLDSGRCDGLARFDGATVDRFLPGRCISMDIASDGTVWVLAGDRTAWVLDEDEWMLAGDQAWGLYVIDPEAVAATE